MKAVTFFLIFTLLLSFRLPDDFYSIVIKTIDGNKLELNKFRDKKILFLVLPITSTDTILSVSDILALQKKHDTSLVIIGIPSEENGFKIGDKQKVKTMYKDQKSNFILAEGMKVKKGERQTSLFQWLTDKNKNRHFNQDVRGVGSKYFVDETGELYAVLGSSVRLNDPIIDRVLSRNLSKK